MNSGRIATAFVLATLFGAQTLVAQSQFKFKEVVQTGDAAPVPPQLGSVLEFAFSYQGNVALIADGGLILKSGGTNIPIAGPGDAAPGGGNFQLFFAFNRLGPVIDDRGDVAFASLLTGTPGGFFGSGGIFLYKNGFLSRIVGPNDPSPDGGVFLYADSPSIDSSGDIAFFAETSAFSFGAFVYSGGKISQVVVAGGIVNNIGLGFVDLPVINNNRHVAFTATLFNGQNAVFAAAPIGDTDPALSDWVLSTHGTPPPPKRIKEVRAKNDLLLSKRAKPRSGAGVKILNPQYAPNIG